MDPGAHAIDVAGLVKRYGSTVAVEGLTLSIAPGEVFGLLGPNGAGKTTTVEILEGYRRPDAGRVRVLGVEPWSAPQLRTRIGVMLQEGGLYPGLRPGELLRLFASYYDDAEDPDELIDLVGLREVGHRFVRRLSGGQQQRLSLALALVGRPSLVFLDEPTAGLDPHARATTWQIVRDLRARGVTVVLTTHAMDEAEQLCDRVAIVDRGRLVALGTPHELTSRSQPAETGFTSEPGLDAAALAARLGLRSTDVREVRAGEYVVASTATPALIAELACWLRERDALVTELRAGRPSLEDVFLRLTTEGRA